MWNLVIKNLNYCLISLRIRELHFREKILNNVWNYDYFGDARTIDTHVKKLHERSLEKRVNTLRQSGEWATNSEVKLR